ncbi:MAG: hypothetical protein LUH01_04995, partial [Parabacteroides gordonii]|nr:hypothetical protein [Parabacteroides gordonii]
MYDREKDLFHPVLFNGNRLTPRAYVSVKDGLLLLGRGEFFKYNYSDRRIVALPIHTTENIRIIFEKACAYNQSDSLILLASRWNGLWEYNVRTGDVRRAAFVKALRLAARWCAAADKGG